VALVWLLGVWPPPLWWRSHWPCETAIMRGASRPRGSDEWRPGSGAACRVARPSALDEVSPLLVRMVVIGEDSRFWSHHGVDLAELGDALGLGRGAGGWTTLRDVWRRRDRLRGASTITQQLVKNLYLSSSRNPLRKIKEAVTALRLELALPKERILALYLNVAEWGSGVWGVEAASHTYFGIPAARLDAPEAAALAATLPQPRTSNPAFRPERMLVRRDLILARYYGAEVAIPRDTGEAEGGEGERERDSVVPVPTPTAPPLDSLGVPAPLAPRPGPDTVAPQVAPPPPPDVPP